MAADRLRFHLDANVDPDVGAALRRAGIDATTANEVGLRTASDAEHFAFATRERRVLVTHDADFLKLGAEDLTHAGIAFSAKDRRTTGQIVNHLMLMYGVMQPEEMTGKIEYM